MSDQSQPLEPSPGLLIWNRRLDVSQRKLRLAACALCRRMESYFDVAVIECLVIAEKFADGLVSDEIRATAREEVQRLAQVKGTISRPTKSKDLRRAISAVYWALDRDALRACQNAQDLILESLRQVPNPSFPQIEAELATQEYLLLDIFGDPVPSIPISPSWRTEIVLGLARKIYDEDRFDLLPILADALMDAGCFEATILDHCRSDKPHARGCWLIDLILEKDESTFVSGTGI